MCSQPTDPSSDLSPCAPASLEPGRWADRRTEPRYRVAVRVEYGADGERRRSNVLDLGADGVFIRTPTPLAPGSHLDLAILLPGQPGVISADGQVVWTNLVETPKLPAGMGIRFLEIAEDGRTRLRRQLQAMPDS